MAIKLKNCKVTIRRRNAHRQIWEVKLSNVIGNIQQAQAGALLEPPWYPTGGTDEEASHLTHFNLFISATPLYVPEAGDQIVITGTMMFNGTYRQIAAGTMHEMQSFNMGYIKMPVVRTSLSTNPAITDSD